MAPLLGRADRLLSPRRDGPLLLIDLHTHSYPASEDAFAAVAEMIDRAKELGIDGICLTDHDAFWPAATVADLRRRHNFPVFAGSEINTDAGHILVFGPQRYIFGMHKPAFLRQEVNRCGGVMIAAHPYRRRFLADPGRKPEARAEMLKRAIADDFFLSCDALEGINGRGTAAENEFSQDLAAVFHLKSTGGSDAHRLEQLGTAATRFDRPITDLPDLIREIKAGRFRAEILK